MSSSRLLNEMTWEDVKEAIEDNQVIVLPVGSTEQHGQHLPLDTDAFLCLSVAAEAAKRSGHAIVAPPVVFGYSPHHMSFPGTITVDPHTLINLLVEVTLSLVHHGFKKVLLLNGHGGNRGPVATAASEAQEKLNRKAKIAAASYFDFGIAKVSSTRDSEVGGMCHSCEYETSLELFLRPQLVRKEKIKRCMPPEVIKDYVSYDLLKPSIVNMTLDTKEISPESGVCGDPTVASAEKGRIFFNAVVDDIAEFLKRFYELEIR